MKTFLNYLLVVMLLSQLFACGNKKASPDLYAEIDLSAPLNTLTAKEKDAGWQLLFNGKTFDGWHGYNIQGIPESWVIEDECLTVNESSGQEAQDIITDEVYRNYAFTVEYKMSEQANSGIIFQVKEDSAYHYPYETGPEFQIIDQDNWPGALEVWQQNGANYAMYPAVSQPGKPVGEWNRLLLVVDGNQVTQYVNGIEVVSYEKYSEDWTTRRNSGKWSNYPDYGKFDEGNISLQNHGTKLWFRNIKIKQL